MSESNQQPFNWRKALGCLAGIIGGGLALVSLLIGVCAGSYEGFQKEDASFYLILAVFGALGIALLIYFYRTWRRP